MVTSQRKHILISSQFLSTEYRAVEDQLCFVFVFQVLCLVSQKSFNFIVYKATALVFTLFTLYMTVSTMGDVLVGIHYTSVCVHS